MIRGLGVIEIFFPVLLRRRVCGMEVKYLFSCFPLRYNVNLGSRCESRVEILLKGKVNMSPEIVEEHLSFLERHSSFSRLNLALIIESRR